jgi:hypothetical protein
MQPLPQVDPSLSHRALQAWRRKCSRQGLVYQQPGQPEAWVRRDGAKFIALANVNGLLAVYRVRSDGGRIAEARDVQSYLRRAYG